MHDTHNTYMQTLDCISNYFILDYCIHVIYTISVLFRGRAHGRAHTRLSHSHSPSSRSNEAFPSSEHLSVCVLVTHARVTHAHTQQVERGLCTVGAPAFCHSSSRRLGPLQALPGPILPSLARKTGGASAGSCRQRSAAPRRERRRQCHLSGTALSRRCRQKLSKVSALIHLLSSFFY
jgi:hypothetical protein